MANTKVAPVITIDGPSGSGKGTVAAHLSQHFGWPLLDSGAIYRVLGLAAQRANIEPEQVDELVALAKDLPLTFVANPKTNEVVAYLKDEAIGDLIRTDEAGIQASRVAQIPEVRDALLQRQRDFRKLPGLVADGRDMGTIVFPDAEVKIFLTASAETRARRRFNQLKEKGIDANLRALLDSIKVRDERDRTRSVAPLVPAEGAFLIDSSSMTIEEVLSQVIDFCEKRL